MGRIKEMERRGSGNRKRNPVVYLICEGSETEIRNFKKFRSRECRIDIVPIPSQYKSADKLVPKARATIGTSPYSPDEGDIIWCVCLTVTITPIKCLQSQAVCRERGVQAGIFQPIL